MLLRDRLADRELQLMEAHATPDSRHGDAVWRCRRRTLGAAVILLGLLSASGCEAPGPPLLRVGLNPWVGYDPLVLGRDLGLVDSRQVKVVELSSSSETLRHMRNAQLDAAAMTLDEALRLTDEGFDIRVIAVMDASAGADVVLARPGLDRPAQLKGETIAVEGSTVGALVLQRLLQAGSLQASDVTILNLEASQHLEALQTQQVGACICYEPMAGHIRAAGFQQIFDSRQMPGEILDVLVVRADVLRERPQQVDELMSAWSRGLRAFTESPERAARLLAPGVDLSPANYLATFEKLVFYTPAQSRDMLSGRPPPLAQSGERLVQTLLSTGLLRGTPDWGQLIDAGPALRASPGGEIRP